MNAATPVWFVALITVVRTRSVALVALAALLFGAGLAPARADDDPARQSIDANPTLSAPNPSGYDGQVVHGQPFFLLSDASYGSNQVAQVRLEAPGREYQSELEGYGGADVVVYKVPNPLAFLKAQKNLHRLNIKPNYQGEGLANTLAYLWDRWLGAARRAWQRVLSFATRSQVTKARPEFRLGDQVAAPTHFEPESRFAPLRGFDLVTRFRYPIWQAKTIQPPKGVKLAGSSSEFVDAPAGNVMIPVGKLAPGLYLVEAMIGSYRAHTLLFVSDTVAAVKASSNGLLVWTARRDDGKPVPNTEVSWTDGVGVLQSGATGADGALALDHVSPERSYVIGSDPQGGVFVSENFYYDSEIYNTKIYSLTDRPLYRPGDTVHVKFIGRTFQSANQSTAPAAAQIRLDVIDPNGAPIASRNVDFASDAGGEASFTLPATAQGGGYTLRFDYHGDTYGGAFRVAEYVKPHFDVNLTMDKADYATGDTPKGTIALRYPDGKPVKHGKVSVTLRAQKVAIVDGELNYSGLFPVKLEQQELETDGDGNVTLTLPAAKDPSRYALTLFARDGAAYRVRVTREVLIARGATPYRLVTAKSFSQPHESVGFTLAALANATNAANAANGTNGVAPAHKPARWELTRLETQTKTEGTLPAPGADGRTSFPLQFDAPGSYMVSVKDDAGNLLAAASHWVAGDGLKAIPGSVEIVMDRDRYRIGDTAEALITFPYAVDDALLTLERDRVEARALLSKGGDWLSLTRVTPTQWKARIKVGPDFAPNMTFSVLYVHDGEYVFQNAGIVVAKPAIDISVKSDKAVYAPGETVTLDLGSALAGQPLPAHLTVSVVDEMVYLLQPEIAPNISDFFYHPRRNNVRTTSSLSFITYDLALSAMRGAPGGPQRGQYNERGVKMLERPRRDDIDTAAWQADLQTDASGHARMTFRMPDALARWRVTVRAISADGTVGQRTAWLRSDKPLYLKWSGPARFRDGDQPVIDMIAFNQRNTDVDAQWSVNGAGLAVDRKVTLKPGANYLTLPRVALTPGVVDAALRVNGRDMDRLQTRVSLGVPGWLDLREVPVALDANPKPLALAPDAQDVRVRFLSGGASQFSRVADDLIGYPYGCAEQTSSRLIPLALAHDVLGRAADGAASQQQGASNELEARLRNQRQRLALLAGINGGFGWWGDTTGGSAFVTAYAYYADWLASRSLGITLPDGNWQHALDIYRDHGAREPLLHRALALWLLQQMGLPVATPVSGVAGQLAQQASTMFDAGKAAPAYGAEDSLVFAAPDSPRGLEMAVVLTAWTAHASNASLPDGFDAVAARARAELIGNPTPLIEALLAMAGDAGTPVDANAVLAQSSATYPTVDRALTLLWLRRAMSRTPGGEAAQPLPVPAGTQWKRVGTPTGASAYAWTGATPPAALEVGAARPEVTAVVSYRSREAQPSRLPVKLERSFYRLDPIAPKSDADKAEGHFTFEAHRVKAGDAIDGNALYVDEVTLTPQDASALHYGLLEVPLPPGGSVEATSWGVSISGLPGTDANGNGPQPFARAAGYEMGELGYHQPVPLLDRPVTLRQLVRFAVPGTFTMPPARYFRMYQPEQKAYEGGRSDRMVTLRVE